VAYTFLHNKLFVNRGNTRFPKEQIVVISEVLPHDLTVPYTSFRDWPVEKVNGTKVQNLKHLAQLIDENKAAFLRIDCEDNWIIILPTDEARKATTEIMSQNGIVKDREFGSQ